MYILFGYKQSTGSPEIRLFGIFETIQETEQRIYKLDGDIKSYGAYELNNVIYTSRYIFWYKETSNITEINTPVANYA